MAKPRPPAGKQIPAQGLRSGVLPVLADIADFCLHPIRNVRRIRAGPIRPTYRDFTHVSPERLTEWHRATGIEAHLLTAIAEAERSGDSQADPGVSTSLSRP